MAFLLKANDKRLLLSDIDIGLYGALRQALLLSKNVMELSQQAGYFDQAHFDKDFKAISGVSPQNYLKTMSDFYYDGTENYHIISPKEAAYELGTVDRLLQNK